VIAGRCRSGRRWFWAADLLSALRDRPGAGRYGWAETEPDAQDAIRQAVEDLAAPVVILRADHARRRLKEISAARRRARPAPETQEPAAVEYLYGVREGWFPGEDGREVWKTEIVKFPIHRKTARRVYYVRRRTPDGAELGYVDRGELESHGEVICRSRGWWDADYMLYKEPPKLDDPPAGEPLEDTVRRLRREAAEVHPDRGGDPEEFRLRFARYQRLKQRLEAAQA